MGCVFDLVPVCTYVPVVDSKRTAGTVAVFGYCPFNSFVILIVLHHIFPYRFNSSEMFHDQSHVRRVRRRVLVTFGQGWLGVRGVDHTSSVCSSR